MNASRVLKPEKALLAGMASIATVTVLILIKAIMFIFSGSTSILASLMDSLADATVSVMTFFAIRFSLKPADGNHRSGHGKIEGLAAPSNHCSLARRQQRCFMNLCAACLIRNRSRTMNWVLP